MEEISSFTVDNFLGGRIRLKQPLSGYRATSDSVLLAAAVCAKPGETLLDVGMANGIVSLCIATRIKNLTLTGVEIQPVLSSLACENAVLNRFSLKAVCQNIVQKPDQLHGQQFHHVFTNPPFYTEAHHRRNQQQKIAYNEQVPLDMWIRYCLKHVRPKGTFTMIHRMEALPDILAVLNNRLGALEVIPIQSKANKPSQRMIIRGTLGSKKPFELKAPFIIYDLSGKYTKQAEDVLRGAQAIL